MHSASKEISQLRGLFTSLEAQLREQQQWHSWQQQHHTQRQREGQAVREEDGGRPSVAHTDGLLKRQNQVLERLLKQATVSKDDLAASNRALESSRDGLQEKVGQLEARCMDVEGQLCRVEQLRAGELEASRALQLESTSHLGRLQQRCLALEADLDRSNSALATATGGLSSLKEEISRLERLHEDKEQEGSTRLREKEREASHLQQRLENKESEAGALQQLLSKADEKITAIQQRLAIKEEECSSLRRLLEEERDVSLRDKERSLRERDQVVLDGEQRLSELQQLSLSLQQCSEQHSAALQRRLDEVWWVG